VVSLWSGDRVAFSKFANASVVHPDITFKGWTDASHGQSIAWGERKASRVVLQQYDPKTFLLSHCTIIASVDTENGSDALGKHQVDGFQVERKWPDWLITPKTAQFINNNNDAWERKLLLACFRTFVGGENYVEHIQIPELSKGKIIDAAARDIGDSVYVDILIATERKHRSLISAIKSGRLQTLSMGCSVEHTTCSKCGNVAYDETQLCPHIRYFKGNKYVDGMGVERIIAELCGHISDEPGSVKFIEASWVANPAFRGAVLRSILSPDEIDDLSGKMSMAFSQPARMAFPGMFQRAARAHFAEGQFDFNVDEGEGGAAPAPKEEKDDPIEKAVGDLVEALRERAIQKLRSEISKDEESPTRSENQNTTIIKEALRHPEWKRIASIVLKTTGRDAEATKRILLGLVLYKRGGWLAVRDAGVLTGRDILATSRILDMVSRRGFQAGEGRIYRTVIASGGFAAYPDEKSYLVACSHIVGRSLTDSEKQSLLRKGRLFALGSNTNAITL
jgi:hypothetical protein